MARDPKYARPVADENQPLLAEPAPIYEAVEAESESNLITNKGKGWNRRKIATYFVVGVLVIALLFVSIKAFVDAGHFEFDLGKALKAAISGGAAGAAAMVLQVLTLMPLRTTLNYQYRYGTTTTQAMRILNADGGWTRFYQGLTPALIQAPVARFGDAAANQGMRSLLNSNPSTAKLPDGVKTFFGSVTAGLFRILLTPIDTLKTTLQTQGKQGLLILRNRVKVNGIGSLWYGALASAAATIVGHFPWWGTVNFLNNKIPEPDDFVLKLCRYAFVGFAASVVSDTVSNSLRVVKTYRQVNETKIGYVDAARAVVAADGLLGLFGRGLKTKILANGLQGLMFNVLWRLFMDLWGDKTE